ncbi:uncharacterized protein LOC125371159 [Ricinus communis]|uniref:uncharacterized protein LOC125371159 n=1 Tax=Ricinus communis TaxID=3988 RepID=UPI00201AF365|nr:uncharacterized protein LOC125371159 [Ricinus communis]
MLFPLPHLGTVITPGRLADMLLEEVPAVSYFEGAGSLEVSYIDFVALLPFRWVSPSGDVPTGGTPPPTEGSRKRAQPRREFTCCSYCTVTAHGDQRFFLPSLGDHFYASGRAHRLRSMIIGGPVVPDHEGVLGARLGLACGLSGASIMNIMNVMYICLICECLLIVIFFAALDGAPSSREREAKSTRITEMWCVNNDAEDFHNIFPATFVRSECLQGCPNHFALAPNPIICPLWH